MTMRDTLAFLSKLISYTLFSLGNIKLVLITQLGQPLSRGISINYSVGFECGKGLVKSLGFVSGASDQTFLGKEIVMR